MEIENNERLSFKQRRAMRRKSKKRKSKLIIENEMELKEEKMEMVPKTNMNNEIKKKFQVVSNENELEIDPSDIMNQNEIINRQIKNLFGKNDIKSNKNNSFHFSESYLETESSKFVKLLSEKYEYNEKNNGDIITNKNVIYLLENEILSIFTLIIGIVDGVLLLSLLFVVINNSNTDFLQKFASLLYIIQFLSYIVAVLLFPYSFILLYYAENKIINKYQKGLFIICSLLIFIICMMEFSISDEIYYNYSQNDEFFSDEINIDQFSNKVSKWNKYLFVKFSFLSVIWILCISFFHESQPNEKKIE